MRLTCEPRDLGGSGKLPKDDPVDRRVGLACAFAQKETPADDGQRSCFASDCEHAPTTDGRCRFGRAPALTPHCSFLAKQEGLRPPAGSPRCFQRVAYPFASGSPAEDAGKTAMSAAATRARPGLADARAVKAGAHVGGMGPHDPATSEKVSRGLTIRHLSQMGSPLQPKAAVRRDRRSSSNREEIRGLGRAPAPSMRATAPDRLLTGASQTIGKRLVPVPSAPASYGRSCQSRTRRRSPQRLDGRTTRRVPRLANGRCAPTRGPRLAFT